MSEPTLNYKVHISLKDVEEPKVWREVIVRNNYSYSHLHYLIQRAMGWRKAHAYVFRIPEAFGGLVWGEMLETEPGELVGKNTYCRDLLEYSWQCHQRGNPLSFTYIYDMGDNWEHTLTVVGKTEEFRFKLLAGAGACPPEDIGGIMGYAQMKQALKGTLPAEATEDLMAYLRSRRLSKFDPEHFDLEKRRWKV